MDDFLNQAKRVNQWISEYLENSGKYPVVAKVLPGDIRNSLPASPPEKAESFDEIFRDFQEKIIPGVTHWNHPAFFAYFAITGSAPGILGEMLSAALNINGMLWKTCPAATELEELAVDWLRQMIGFPEGMFGLIMDTASTGTFCAMSAARQRLPLQIREKGMTGRDLPQLRVYASEHTHNSIDKAAIALGFGQNGIRKIASDAEFRMRPELLKQAIEEDLQRGVLPVCVVATAGTTSTSSVDPLEAIADICERQQVWLHVDAAYAGSAAILPEKRDLFRGAERADSFLFNPHKWLFVPFDCTAFFTRHPEILRSAFSLVPEFLRTQEDAAGVHNFMDYGIQLGRRFRALKLWMVIRMFGVEGLREALRKHIRLAQDFAEWVRHSGNFEMMAPVPFSLVCFRAHPPEIADSQLNDLNVALMDRINASGESYLSHTKLNDQIILRVAIGNLNTEERHLLRLQELLVSHLDDAIHT